jgi:hypothetical protein
MRWMIYSLGNRKSWDGTFEHYLNIEEFLCSRNAGLQRIRGLGGDFFDYFMVTEQYVNEMQRAIDTALASVELDEEMEYHLMILREVYRGGSVIMG